MSSQLPPLPDIEKITPFVTRILGGNPGKLTTSSHSGTNSYLLGSPNSSDYILIDTTSEYARAPWFKRLTSCLPPPPATTNITLLLTHHHADHIGGVPILRSLYPSLKVYKLRSSNSDSTEQGDQGTYNIAPYESIHQNQTWHIPGVLSVRAILTPGHTDDHVCFVLSTPTNTNTNTNPNNSSSSNNIPLAETTTIQETPIAIFTGDTILGHGTAVFSSLKSYIHSLSYLHDLFTSYSSSLSTNHPIPIPAYPAHGAMIPDGASRAKEYITHRQEREDQVLNTLRGNFTSFPSSSSSNDKDDKKKLKESRGERMTAREIVETVYQDVEVALHDAAERGVRQILEKLELEGVVGRARAGDAEEGWEVLDMSVGGDGNEQGKGKGSL
ncbi:MAG: hypothetical protein M1834_008871 [Cirrosporium novae-zelandiae]|nr:MAG: hypothetical protein M1834_008871 [Cirrosporium novae-zelandiae]